MVERNKGAKKRWGGEKGVRGEGGEDNSQADSIKFSPRSTSDSPPPRAEEMLRKPDIKTAVQGKSEVCSSLRGNCKLGESSLAGRCEGGEAEDRVGSRAPRTNQEKEIPMQSEEEAILIPNIYEVYKEATQLWTATGFERNALQSRGPRSPPPSFRRPLSSLLKRIRAPADWALQKSEVGGDDCRHFSVKFASESSVER